MILEQENSIKYIKKYSLFIFNKVKPTFQTAITNLMEYILYIVSKNFQKIKLRVLRDLEFS